MKLYDCMKPVDTYLSVNSYNGINVIGPRGGEAVSNTLYIYCG